MIRSYPAAKLMQFILCTYLLHLYTTGVVWQTKGEPMTCITCVSLVFTGNCGMLKLCPTMHVHTNFKALHVVNVQTHACNDMCVCEV